MHLALPESEGKSLLVRLEVMLIFTLVDHKRSACGCACFRPRHRLSDHQTRAQSISFNYNILEQGKIPNRNANDLSICAITSWSKKTFPTQMEMHPQIVA